MKAHGKKSYEMLRFLGIWCIATGLTLLSIEIIELFVKLDINNHPELGSGLLLMTIGAIAVRLA